LSRIGLNALWCLPVCAVVSGLRAQAPADAPDPALLSELSALDGKLAGVGDLTADFTERKWTALLKKPLLSTGTVRVKPPRMRWETAVPHRSVMTMDDAEIRILYPDRNTIEAYPLGGAMRFPAMSPLPRLAQLQEQFELSRMPESDADAASEGLLAVRLVPRDESLAEHVIRIDVWIDRETACAERVVLHDTDGDRTEISFTHVRTNVGLSDEDVTIAARRDVKVTYPLGPNRAGGGGRDAGER
jgi:outer membrane lipoprotein-sorting protein